MRKIGTLKASLFAASALLFAVPAAAQPGDHHSDIAQEQADDHSHEEEPAAARDPNAIPGTIPEPASTRTEHRVQMRAGQRYVITVQSEAFDPMLKLMRAGSTDVIAEDDDSGGGTIPRIVYTPTQAGEYVVEVGSFVPSGHGEYALSVTPQAPLPALVTRPTRTERSNWEVFQGNLADSDSVDLGKRYDDYELRMAAGQTAMIQVLGTGELDTVVQVFAVDQRGLTPIATDDDSGGGVNPFVLFAPEEAGTYVVRVVGFDDASRGAYRLRVLR
jgi:hypothetical protein